MLTNLKELLESKTFWTSLLSAIAAGAAVFHYDVPVGTIMAVLTPIMILIGATGWSEVAKMKLTMQHAHEQKMLSMQLQRGLPALVSSAAAGEVKPAGGAQAGFSKLGVMIVVALLGTIATFGVVLSQSSCGSVQPVVTDVIDCAKAEAATVSNGYSIIQVVNTVFGVLQGKPMPGCEQASNIIECDVEKLAVTFGEDIVACVVDSFPEPAAGSGAQESLAVANKHKALPLAAKGKKISHTYKKGS